MLQFFLSRSRILYRSSFRKFALATNEIQQTASLIQKRKKMSQLYSGFNEEQKASMINILNFIRDKPRTGLSSKSLIKYLNNRFFEEVDFEGKDLDEIMGLLQNQDQGEGKVTLERVDEFLGLVQKVQGKGSANKKIQMLDNIVEDMSVDQIRTFMRILAKNLRIGLTQKSFDFKKDAEQSNAKSERKEQAGSEKKNEGKDKVKIPDLQFMLAKPLRDLKQVEKFCESKGDQELIADLKYDGERTLIMYKKGADIKLLSRRKKWQTDVYKPLTEILFKELSNRPQIQSIQIDAEIVLVQSNGEHLPMQNLLKLRGKELNSNGESQLKVFAFDVIEYNGEDLTNKALKVRRTKIPSSEHISVSQCIQFTYPEQKEKLMDYYKKQLEKKHEGVIIKGQNDLYFTNGSRRHWGKLKKGCKIESQDTGQIDLDLVVMGVMDGEGKNNMCYSAFLLGVYHEGKFHPVSKVGTGFSKIQLDELTQTFQPLLAEQRPANYEIPKALRVDHYVKPQVVFQVTCQDLSRSPHYKLKYEEGEGGISLRFPVFQRIREDKDPQSCKSQDLFQHIDLEENK